MPFRRIEITTPLSPAEVQERLQQITRGPIALGERLLQTYKREPDEPPFAGSVSTDSFRIQRDFRGSHRFLPVVRGRIAGDGAGGSTVAITMTIPLFTAVQMTFLFAIAVMFMVLRFPVRLWDPATLILPALLVVGGATLALRFYPATYTAEELIRNALGHPPPR